MYFLHYTGRGTQCNLSMAKSKFWIFANFQVKLCCTFLFTLFTHSPKSLICFFLSLCLVCRVLWSDIMYKGMCVFFCPSQNLQLPWEYEVYPVSWLDVYWGVDFFFWPGKTCSWLILDTVAPWGLWGLSWVLTWCMLWSWFRKFVDPLYYFYSFSTISLYFMFSDFQLAQAACVCCNGTKGNPNILFWLVSQK